MTKDKKLRQLTDKAILVCRSTNTRGFTKGWLGQSLGIDKSATSQVISQLKKDEFLHNQTSNAGDFQDPLNRGKYYRVRGETEGWFRNGRYSGESEEAYARRSK